MSMIRRTTSSSIFPLKLLSSAIALSISVPVFSSELIEEVVVTAQKREENLQEVPIAISAFSGSALNELGAENLNDIGKYTAGVEMNNQSVTQPTYNVRGIQTSDFTVGSDPAVAVYVDGVYSSRGAGAEVPFFDIERVEILKGPQGTLFGRNATGGAIHILTKQPNYQFYGQVRGSVGNFDKKDIDFSLNTPISETLAFRISGNINRRDGYLENAGSGPDFNDADNHSIRTALLWEPTDETTILFRANYGEMDQNSGAVFTMVNSIYEGAFPGDRLDPFGDVGADFKSIEDRDLYSISIEVTHEFKDMTLTSITAYGGHNSVFINDEDGSANPNHFFGSNNVDDQDQFSQEFRLTGATEKLKWTAGLTYSKEHVDHTTHAYFNTSTLESFAVYEGLKQQLSSQGFTDAEIAEMVPGARALNQAGLNPAIVDPALGGNPALAGVNVDGIAMSSFAFDLLRGTPNGQVPFDPSNPATSLLAATPVSASIQSACGLGALPAMNTLDQIYGTLLSVNPATAAANTLFCAVLPQVQPAVMANSLWAENVRNTGTYESTAIYGDVTYSLTEKMDLTLGARYTYDEKSFTIETAYQNTLLGIPFGLAFYNNGQPVLDTKESNDWEALSGRVVLNYRWNDDLMTYGSVATGFKAGGFNSLNFGPNIETSYDQEEVINYELGLKSTWLEGALRFNAAAYFYEYDNLQELSLVGFPIPSYNLRNADADGSGVEFELMWAVNSKLFLGANYSYLDTEYTEYEVLVAAGEDPVADDKTGTARASTPRNKLNIMAEYTFDLERFGQLALRADYNYTDDRIGSITDPSKIIDSYELWNMRATFQTSDEQWEVAAWMTNVTDEEILGDYSAPGEAIGSFNAWRYPPRMYGVDVTYRFE